MYNKDMIAFGEARSVIRELFEYGNQLAEKIGRENVFDYSLGNPSVPTPQQVNDTLKHLIDSDPSVHAYTSAQGLKSVREKIAEYNHRVHNMQLNPEHIYVTCGANAGLSICLRAAVSSNQDEVVLLTPYYPEYTVFIKNAGAKAVPVPMDEINFQIDFDALKKALTSHTVAVIVNSPNNPSGIVYSKQTIIKLAATLKAAEEKFGTTILLISDEPYREIVFEGKFESPVSHYDDSVLCYSYSKSFSLPGERIGYIALPDTLNNVQEFYYAVMGAGRSLGYVCAPSIFQKAVEACIDQSSDINPYRENRDILIEQLTKLGFEVVNPQGAFYLLLKIPNGDAIHFSDFAKTYGILTVPANTFGLPGYVRIATCVKKEMIERSIPAWKQFATDYFNSIK